MLVEISLKASAYSDWGVFEGVREIFQNMRDGHLDGYTMGIQVTPNSILFSNMDASLPREALLIGHTTKEDRDDQAGQFGEGLKLGSLALVRAGRKITIQFGKEIWTPKIVKSNVYDAEVLAFDIQEIGLSHNGLCIEIDLFNEEWEDMKYNFLTLVDYESASCEEGEILLDPRLRGKVYVKDIFVQEDDDLEYGYNLLDVKTDRDRRMVDAWDMKNAVRCIWKACLTKDSSLYRPFWDMLNSDKKDTSMFKYAAAMVPDQIVERVVSDFRNEHGENAYPVLYESDARDLGHFGGKGVVVSSEALARIIWRDTGDVGEIKCSLSSSVQHKYDRHELKGQEKLNLFKAVVMVAKAAGEKDLESKVDVVDFSSPTIFGQYKDERYLLARRALGDLFVCITTLIHEVAHREGVDGEKSHVHRIEIIWAKLFEQRMG